MIFFYILWIFIYEFSLIVVFCSRKKVLTKTKLILKFIRNQNVLVSYLI